MALFDVPIDAAELTELEKYDALVAEGGRPSHPRELLLTIVKEPGEYRDILNYWQRHPNDWNVFSRQLASWRSFHEFQRNARVMSSYFDEYASDVDDCLARNGFQYPESVVSASAVLKRDAHLQGGLGTWIEYVYRQYCKQEKLEDLVDRHRKGYEAARLKLLSSGVLASHEKDQDRLERLCDPAGEYMARHMIERRFCAGAETGPRETRLELMDQRTDALREFHKTTMEFRRAVGELEHHEARLRWALAQVPLVEQEAAEAAEAEAAASWSGPSTLESFMLLPLEIRHMIWLHCLPVGPSSHFFDIINHPRKRHMAHCWSSCEFGVSATSARDSAYLPVYALLATCRESRLAVEAYYRHWSPGANKTYEGWSSPEDPFGNFETFDWIPADDLIVLCFPPREAQLPSVQALSFARGPARNVGILVTLEMYHLWGYGPSYNGGRPNMKYNGWRSDMGLAIRDHDDGSQMEMIAHFIEALRGDAGSGDESQGGVKAVHVIVQGVRDMGRPFSSRSGPPGKHGGVVWSVHKSLGCETIDEWHYCGVRPWTRSVPVLDESEPPPTRGEKWPAEVGEAPRLSWRLGSSESQYLVEPARMDAMERRPMWCVIDLSSMIWDSCVNRGWPELERCFMLGRYDPGDYAFW